MKKLYLIRHGKSDWKAGIKTDFERPLNERGQKDAPNMGKYLSTHYDFPELIVSSPALRAISTARIMANELSYPLPNIQSESMIYEAPLQDLLYVISHLPDDKDIIYLFGHNPGFSMLTAYLSDQYVEMKTCNISVLQADIDSWKMVVKGIFTLNTLLSPKSI